MPVPKDLDVAHNNATSNFLSTSPQRQRPATPTAIVIGRNGSNDPIPANMYKSSMQEPAEQQLEAYGASFSASNRQDLIQRLKRSQSPTWQRNGSISPMYKTPRIQESPSKVSLLPPIDLDFGTGSMELDHDSRDITEAFLEAESINTPVPVDEIEDKSKRSNPFPQQFHEDLHRIERGENAQLSTSPSWYKPLPSPVSHAIPVSKSIDIPNIDRTPPRLEASSRNSLSSSFVLRPPTSPLAQQSNNDEMDFSTMDLAASPTKTTRRHTLPPHSFHALTRPAQTLTLAQAARQPQMLKRENSLPFQSHQARRSYTGIPFPTSPSPSTPNYLRSRRSSFASDASPIQASMVGSYEESILRGRMSTTPSKPQDFTASIGALGHGDCKPKHPAHVTVEFPAVYYSWPPNNGGSITDEPGPYVGLIDLEHKLNVPAQKEAKRKHRETHFDEVELNDSSVKSREARRNEKRRKRSQSPGKTLQSFGGCYRIPQQGQLQILLKNPNKTAVKFFLVAYDLEGMQPGTKTFVRQRSYSARPIVEPPMTSRSFSDSIIETKKPARTKSILRYLIQLNICCPAKDRFYLYKSVNVVFPNRAPDDKEELHTEILWPEPRYSAWKPSTTESGASTPSRRQSIDIDMARRSYTGGSFNALGMDALDGIPTSARDSSSSSHLELFSMSQASQSPISAQTSQLAFRDINPDIWTKLNRGESGYGGRTATPESGESLLARRLRGLNNEPNDTQEDLGVGTMDME